MTETPSDPSGAGSAPEGDAPDELAVFWEAARSRSKRNPVPTWTGPGVPGTLVPPAFAFGDDPVLADALLELVLAGVKTATSTALVELESSGEPMPVVGDLSIVLDGGGHPRALLRTTSVRLVRFADVDAEHAAAEGEDDRTLESWRREHERYWRRVLPRFGAEFSPDLELVLERFELRFPTAWDR
ncbi:MAG: ASCH domain-containing protein [Actinomycetales bacterium]|nr:ASCH domain-containing protein [Actinomycetales bacterium]